MYAACGFAPAKPPPPLAVAVESPPLHVGGQWSYGSALCCPQRDTRAASKNETLSVCGGFFEADARTRTADPFITSEVLYQLSYVGGAVGV